jgi:hypothetical protein
VFDGRIEVIGAFLRHGVNVATLVQPSEPPHQNLALLHARLFRSGLHSAGGPSKLQTLDPRLVSSDTTPGSGRLRDGWTQAWDTPESPEWVPVWGGTRTWKSSRQVWAGTATAVARWPARLHCLLRSNHPSIEKIMLQGMRAAPNRCCPMRNWSHSLMVRGLRRLAAVCASVAPVINDTKRDITM